MSCVSAVRIARPLARADVRQDRIDDGLSASSSRRCTTEPAFSRVASEIVYRAKADPPRGAVRLTSVVGGRNPAHSTSVGKALLSQRPHSVSELTDYFGPDPLEARTPNTLTSIPDLAADLDAIARRGYAIDDEENELGITCVAVPVYTDSSPTPVGAISISAVTFRCPKEQLVGLVPTLRATIQRHLGPGSLGPGVAGPETN